MFGSQSQPAAVRGLDMSVAWLWAAASAHPARHGQEQIGRQRAAGQFRDASHCLGVANSMSSPRISVPQEGAFTVACLAASGSLAQRPMHSVYTEGHQANLAGAPVMEPAEPRPRPKASEARGGMPHRGRRAGALVASRAGSSRSRSRAGRPTGSPSLFTLTVSGPQQFVGTLMVKAAPVQGRGHNCTPQ